MPTPHSSPPAPARDPVLVRLADLNHQPARATAAVADMDALFFEASGRTFADTASKDRFRDLWLGQYLRRDRAHVWLALDSPADSGSQRVVGYLIGSRTDPARDPRFAELPYFAALAEPCRRTPAHLHINLAASHRGRGTGGRLIEAFCGSMQDAGEPGVHVVTGAAARNVSFYRRAGFAEVARCDWNGRPLVMLVRDFTRARC